MSENPLISVIVPVYNVEKYLRKCLDSICGQTYRNLEILCVNDGSTDGSAAILEEYAARDSRIRVINQKNAGISAARNTGLAHVSGEWIAWVDSDDYLESDTYRYALANVDDETDIICFGAEVIWQDAVRDPHMDKYFDLNQSDASPSIEDITRTPATLWNKLWRTKFVRQYEAAFPVGLWYEDMYMHYTLTPYARKIAYRPEKKYRYVRHAGSIMSETTAFNPKVFDHLKIAKETLEFYRKYPLPERMRRFRLLAFMINFSASLDYVPKDRMKDYLREAYDIAEQYGLMRQYGAELRFLKPVPWYRRCFVRHKTGKSYYGIPGLPFLTISRKSDKEEYRFMGVKICSRPFKEV